MPNPVFLSLSEVEGRTMVGRPAPHASSRTRQGLRRCCPRLRRGSEFCEHIGSKAKCRDREDAMVSSSGGREAANVAELTFGEAKKIVQRVEDLFGKADLPNIIRGFTADAVARFADFPELRGREAIGKFLAPRFARQRDHRLKKHLRIVKGEMIGNQC